MALCGLWKLACRPKKISSTQSIYPTLTAHYASPFLFIMMKSLTNGRGGSAKKEKAKSKASLTRERSPLQFSISRQSGGQFSNLSPVFSKDEKYVFLCTNNEARVYSSTTGDLVQPLTAAKISKSWIVAIFLHPTNEYRLITVFSGGRVLIWDWTDGTLLRQLTLSNTTVKSAVLVATTLVWTDGKNVSMCKDFPTLEEIHHIQALPECTTVAANKEHIFAFGGRTMLIFKLATAATTYEHEQLTLTAGPTSIAVSDNHIAYSDKSGAIYLHTLQAYPNNAGVTPRTLHWHAKAVSTLEFALEGDYLLSGGKEGVLVLWQVSTSTKQFLPRIAGKIDAIGVSKTSKLYALKLDDNVIKIITATDMSLQAEVIGPRYSGGNLCTTVEGDNVILCNGAEAQAWNIPSGRTGLRMPITSLHYGGLTKDNFRARENSVIDCAVRGNWFATIDDWASPEEENLVLGQFKSRNEVFLKFWKWNGTSHDLVTRIDNPHGAFPVRQVMAAGDGSFFTAGDDASIKMWRPKAVKKDMVNGGTQIVGTTWSCRRFIKFTRTESACRMALSSDGTVLAMSVREHLFLVDVVTGRLIRSLPTGTAGETHDLGFVKNFLVILGHKKLVVWDLISTCVSYALSIHKSTSAMHLSCGSETFALTTADHSGAKIYIFNPHTAKPIFRTKSSRTISLLWSHRHGYLQITRNLELIQITSSTITSPAKVPEMTTSTGSHGGISSVYRVAKNRMPVEMAQEIDQQRTVLNGQALTTIFEDSISTLENKFENLAALVLGKAE